MHSTLMAKVIDTVTPTTTPKRISWPDTLEGNTAVYTVLATRTEIDGIIVSLRYLVPPHPYDR